MINAVLASVGPFIGRLVTAETDKEVPASDLNPIAPELKELLWGFGSFAVFALVFRYALWPPLKASIDARNQRIADDLATAEAVSEAARSDVEAYEAKRAEIRAEAHQIIESARAVVEAERTERIAAANAEIARRRADAMARVTAEREAARGEVDAAVMAVTASILERAIGTRPDDAVVRRAVEATSASGVAS